MPLSEKQTDRYALGEIGGVAETASDRSVAVSASGFTEVRSDLETLVAGELRPLVEAIDQKGVYPDAFMRAMGAQGGFEQAVPQSLGGPGRGLKYTIQLMEDVARECLSTGFCVWCQTVCAWYIQTGESEFLKRTILPEVMSGRRLAGTGLSNPMKHFAGIEKIRISAQRTSDGFVLNGALPWVSNVAPSHYFACVAKIADEEGYLMALIPGDSPGLTLGDGGHFIALEGSSTHNAIFKDVFVPTDWVLAAPCHDYIRRIRPGFVLAQTGFGLGMVESCIDLMCRSNNRVGHVNCYLDDTVDTLSADLARVRAFVYAVADEIGCGETGTPDATAPTRDLTADAVQGRIDVSELALRASQAAMLHTGATGYRTGSVAERKLRESYFVAIVTPALKHLKKLQHDMAR